MGSSLNKCPFQRPSFKAAVPYWVLKRGPSFRELPISKSPLFSFCRTLQYSFKFKTLIKQPKLRALDTHSR